MKLKIWIRGADKPVIVEKAHVNKEDRVIEILLHKDDDYKKTSLYKYIPFEMVASIEEIEEEEPF